MIGKWKTPQARQRSLMALADSRACGKSNRWRGQIARGKHCHPLVNRLVDLLNEDMISMDEAGRRAGLNGRTISDWRKTRNPSFRDLEAAFNTLGYDLRPVKRREKIAA